MNLEESLRVASSVRTEMLRLHETIEKLEIAIARLAQEKAELKEHVKFWKDTAHAVQTEMEAVAKGKKLPWTFDAR